jgi:hypothetical protein
MQRRWLAQCPTRSYTYLTVAAILRQGDKSGSRVMKLFGGQKILLRSRRRQHIGLNSRMSKTAETHTYVLTQMFTITTGDATREDCWELAGGTQPALPVESTPTLLQPGTKPKSSFVVLTTIVHMELFGPQHTHLVRARAVLKPGLHLLATARVVRPEREHNPRKTCKACGRCAVLNGKLKRRAKTRNR